MATNPLSFSYYNMNGNYVSGETSIQSYLTSGAAKVVGAVYTNIQDLASASLNATESFLDRLNNSVYLPPTISITWNAITEPTIPDVGEVPDLETPTFVTPNNAPTALSISATEVDIDDFTEAPPDVTFSPTPTINYGTIPVVPTISDVDVPPEPTLDTIPVPPMLSLNNITFAGVDLHEDMLADLMTRPTLDIVKPTPYTFNRSPDYGSVLLEGLKARINERLNGGTGLPPAIEQAIWDRARDRETSLAQANIDEVMRKSEAMGFRLPTGSLSAQLRQAEQVYYDKMSELSRDISIKQAELEQDNLKTSIASGIQLEQQLMDHMLKLEQINFEVSKAYADNAIQVYNAEVENFKSLLASYQTYASAYKTIIDAEMAKVEVYKAELQGEQTKAQINVAKVEQYKAQISANMAYVEIYKAQVGAAQTLVSLEQAKISAAGEQIRAYVAQVNAETSKVEAFKAGVQAEMTKVETYKTKVQAYAAKVGAQAEKAKTEAQYYTAMYQAKASEWEGYKTRVIAESERVKAIVAQNTTIVDAYRAGTTAVVAKAEVATKKFEAQIKEYEASQNIVLQTAKANNDALIATNAARLDASKVGAQVYAQLTASAYNMIHASANISDSGSKSASYSFEAASTIDMPGRA